MTRWRRVFLIFCITAACVGCDQSTKAAATAHLPKAQVLSFAGDTLRLQYTENRGAFLGLGASLPAAWRALAFTGAVAVFLGCLLGYLLFVSSLPTSSLVPWSLVWAGGLSNLVDRIVYGGYVVDFINIGFGALRTGIFNIADVAITSGLLLLIFAVSRGQRHA